MSCSLRSYYFTSTSQPSTSGHQDPLSARLSRTHTLILSRTSYGLPPSPLEGVAGQLGWAYSFQMRVEKSVPVCKPISPSCNPGFLSFLLSTPTFHKLSRPPGVVGWPMCLCVCPFFPPTWEACIPGVDSLSGLLDPYICKIRCRHFRELNPSVLSGMKRSQHRDLAFSGLPRLPVLSGPR